MSDDDLFAAIDAALAEVETAPSPFRCPADRIMRRDLWRKPRHRYYRLFDGLKGRFPF